MNLKPAGGLPVLVCFTNAPAWARIEERADRLTLRSPLVRTPWSWDQLVVSWNVEPAQGSGLSVQVEVLPLTGTIRLYHLGNWSLDGSEPILRSSVRGQDDDAAEVKTDTLVLKAPIRGFHLRIEAHGALARHPERLRLLAVSLCNTRDGPPDPRPPRREVWGHTLPVPERSQVSYRGGEGWCSPTTVSMLLAWWTQELGWIGIDRDVPEVAAGVHDPAWRGTGNWPFNTAYAGSLHGLTACAARLRDLRAVEDLIAARIPVVLSVSAPALRGRPATPDSGHLVVCVGFTDSGDLVVNDPWARFEDGQRVRRIYARANVERAWGHSHQLAYLIAPTRRASAFPALWR
jgi:hypothetical protein